MMMRKEEDQGTYPKDWTAIVVSHSFDTGSWRIKNYYLFDNSNSSVDVGTK
jgi:hypothetical protein